MSAIFLSIVYVASIFNISSITAVGLPAVTELDTFKEPDGRATSSFRLVPDGEVILQDVPNAEEVLVADAPELGGEDHDHADQAYFLQFRGNSVSHSRQQRELSRLNGRPRSAPVCPSATGAADFLKKTIALDNGKAFAHRHCQDNPNPQTAIRNWSGVLPPECTPATYGDRLQSIRGAFGAWLQIANRAQLDDKMWAVSDGALIGQQRCGDLMTWDDDGDVVVAESEEKKLKKLIQVGERPVRRAVPVSSFCKLHCTTLRRLRSVVRNNNRITGKC